jgi:hypothetical protein
MTVATFSSAALSAAGAGLPPLGTLSEGLDDCLLLLLEFRR